MLILFALLGCATERCYDACHTLYGKGEDVCGGPDVRVDRDGWTATEAQCRDMCVSSEEQNDRDLDEERRGWQECVGDYAWEIRKGSREYGEPDWDACLEASTCGSGPCEYRTGSQRDGWECSPG